MLKLYNTLARKIEEFKPINPPKVGMYSCGPTVSDYPHIGNLRTYTNTDILCRVLAHNGYEVKQVMNITDVGHLISDQDTGEDKMEMATKREKKDAREIAKFYEKEFLWAMEELNIKKPAILCRATEHIQEMITLIKKIEGKGYTYKTSDGIYFDASKIADYNKLSGMPLEKLKEGARVEYNPEKKNPTDFALWKFLPKTGPKRQMEWDSPWGVGFPGWHIECSAMCLKYLGDAFENSKFHPERSRRIDIHTGGVDHIPIHHTNEIAQNEAATGHRVVNYWIHNEFLLVEGQKMGKSLQNFYNLRDIEEKKFAPLALRYLFLTVHYRQQMNFTWDGLAAAQTALGKLYELVRAWRSGQGRKTIASKDAEQLDNFQKLFREKINNDLNLPEALAAVWETAKSNLPESDKLDLVLEFDQVLGLRLAAQTEIVAEIPNEIRKLAKKRENLREEKKWEEADKIRKEIEQAGFMVEDTPEGLKIKAKSRFY